MDKFLAIQVQWSIHHRHLIKEFFTLWINVLLVGTPCEKSTGRRVTKGEEHIGGTIPLPSFARRPSTMNSFFPAKVPQNSMADQQRHQISELHFDKFPTPWTFSCQKIRFETQVSSCSGFPRALLWIEEVEMVESVDDVKSSSSIQGYVHFPNFEMLDARIASVLNKIIQITPFKKKVSLEEQKAQKEDRFLRGRQIAYMIYDYFRVTGAHDTVLDYADLFSVTLHDDNIQEFDTIWDEVLLSLSKIPSDDILDSLYKWRIRESEKLKTVLELNDMEIHQKISMPDYQKLKTMVKSSIDQKPDCEILTPEIERIETAAVVTSCSGLRGVERGQGVCCQWKAKGQCSKGDKCSFRHESSDRVKPTPKAEAPSEPQSSKTRGRSVSRKRSIRGKSNHGAILRQPCRCYLKGTCTRSSCEHWHPPECQFYKTETGCKAEDKMFGPA